MSVQKELIPASNVQQCVSTRLVALNAGVPMATGGMEAYVKVSFKLTRLFLGGGEGGGELYTYLMVLVLSYCVVVRTNLY